MTTPEAFTVRDVFEDATATFKRRFDVHLSFAGLYLGGLCALIVLFGCLIFVSFAIEAVSFGPDPRAPRSVGEGVVIALLNVLIPAAVLLATSAQQGFTLAVSVADLRGEVLGLGTGLRRMNARLRALFGVAIVRFVADAVVAWAVTASVGLALWNFVSRTRGAGPRLANDRSMDLLGPMLLTGGFWIALVMLWLLVVRSVLGVAGAASQAEAIGPVAAIARSRALLSGRRLHFMALRLSWGAIATVLVALSYVLVRAILVSTRGGDWPTGLFVVPFAYFTISLICAFDSVLEAAYYARLVPSPQTSVNVAEVFV